ncbi:hypothetical protein FOL47_009130 [Perkinsus chesapeaki]|uniref:subtilisin n=1 Tax=Perkinsus chesapeaki TaxID=330153 RepID=A0A7J6LAW3_PERCH|nr:hypothetical protein FOL47_009130 [Perkinsus chesapeaki]
MSHSRFALAVVFVRVASLHVIEDDYPVDDPLYGRQKGYLEAINVPAAWSRLWRSKTVREKVTVAICDTGVSRHPDLVNNLVDGYNVADHNTNTTDTLGHGTKMAGVVGATINNKLAIAGVADLVIDAVDYAIRNQKTKNIKIVVMANSCRVLTEEYIRKFREADAAGLLMIVTAGNEGLYNRQQTLSLPSKMQIRGTSNFANYLDIAAPGDQIITTTMDSSVDIMAGTSPAAALVAGVAAMLSSISPDLPAKL